MAYQFDLVDSTGEGSSQAELVETRKGLSRRAIEQVAYIKDVNSLAVLAGMNDT